MPVQITPKQLIFNDGATICALKNAGSGLVAYKIRVNVPHTFHVNPAEGFVVCGESVDVTMALKQATSVDKLSDKVKNAKFQFETAELTADEEATFQGQEPRKVFMSLASMPDRVTKQTLTASFASGGATSPAKPTPAPAPVSKATVAPVRPLPVYEDTQALYENKFPMYTAQHVKVTPQTLTLREMADTASYGYLYISNTGDVEMAYSISKNGNKAFSISAPEGTIPPGDEATVEVCFLARNMRQTLEVGETSFLVSLVDVPIELLGSRTIAKMFPPHRDAARVVRRTISCQILAAATGPATDPVGIIKETIAPTLTGPLMDMFVKCVSRDTNDKLNEHEMKELKSVKAALSEDEWKACLNLAREERNARSQRRTMALEELSTMVDSRGPVVDANREVPPAIRKSPARIEGDHYSRVNLTDVSSNRHAADAPRSIPSASNLVYPTHTADDVNMKSMLEPATGGGFGMSQVPHPPLPRNSDWSQIGGGPTTEDGMGTESLDMDMIRASSLRMDSAYTAGKALMETMDRSSNPQSKEILGAMLTALEKSKTTIDRLANKQDPMPLQGGAMGMSGEEASRIAAALLSSPTGQPLDVDTESMPKSYSERIAGSPIKSPLPSFPTNSQKKPLYHRVGGGELTNYPYVRTSLATTTMDGIGHSAYDYSPRKGVSGSSQITDFSPRGGGLANSAMDASMEGDSTMRYSSVQNPGSLGPSHIDQPSYSSPSRANGGSPLRSSGFTQGFPTSSSRPLSYESDPTTPSAGAKSVTFYDDTSMPSALRRSASGRPGSTSSGRFALNASGIGPFDTDLQLEGDCTPGAANIYRSAVFQANPKNAAYAAAMEERARAETGQTFIRRVCVAPGPMVKAFEEFPIRVDTENSSVDVVWREHRGPLSPYRTVEADRLKTHIGTPRGNSVLRRERYNFNHVYTGPGAMDRLDDKVRLWTRQALTSLRDVTFTCTACGENGPDVGLSPPMSMALGDRGNTGVTPVIVEECFKFLADSISANSPGHLYSYKTVAQAAQQAAAAKTEALFRVTISAALVKDGTIHDLLGGSDQLMGNVSGLMDGTPTQPTIVRNNIGRYQVDGVRQVALRSPADLERVVGVLLGKRFAIQDLQRVLELTNSVKNKNNPMNLPDNLKSALRLDEQIRHLHKMDGSKLLSGVIIDSPHINSHDVTMMVTISVTKSAVGFGQSTNGLPIRGSSRPAQTNFTVLAPCGDEWSVPGHELTAYMEGLTAAPYTPPPSLLRSSVISQLLLSAHAPSQDHIVIGGIVRNYNKPASSRVRGTSKPRPPFNSSALKADQMEHVDTDRLPDKNELINNALQTLRTISNG